MDFTTLITVNELREHLDDPHLVILDARFTLDDEQWGKAVYAEGHIPGAHQADTADDLAGPIITGVTGRRPFPDPADFAATLSAWGIDDSTQVVAYDADGGLMSAARIWVMLRWMGHDRVAVLDGGWQAWLAADGPVERAVPTPTPRTFTPRLRPEVLADVDEVDAARQRPLTCVFDSRGAEGYHGGGVYHDPVRGHIAGAGLADRAHTLTDGKYYRSPEELREHYVELIGDQSPEDIIFYCGSGITAAQNVLAMTVAGLPGSRMYVGSWSEWITDPSRPVEL
ncbi:MAG: sulfurtransferase [Candidatus Nanopelagicales bacterium]|jgi:thiosulfate/3-mercaptopyruvate sulfurtransferase